MRTEYERCVSVLNAETELAGKICAMVTVVRRAVESRAWTDFEPLMGNLAQSGAEFEALEREREAAFAALAEKTGENGAAFVKEAGFYALAARLPPEERKALSALYRGLKMNILRVGIENTALMNYLNGLRGIVSDFIAAAFPDRKGRLYSRRGGQVHADMRSMVLNRQF
ncbi:MAG: hypothetical protein LBP80_05560 [Treponema sp.]|jgi:hypothetical protein|nr:hypothetical protein [Treponema sp.]